MTSRNFYNILEVCNV